MSITVPLEGFGGGSNPLNFKVVGGTSAPSNPKENTIWVNTDVPITGWIFSATEPEATAEGMVLILTGADSPAEFNALKKNGIQVLPMSAKQYVGGAWVDKPAKVYKNGEWISLDVHLYLIQDGVDNTDLTGGWQKASFNTMTNNHDASFTSKNGAMTLSIGTEAGTGTSVGRSTKNAIDLTNIKSIIITCEATAKSGGSYPDGGGASMYMRVSTTPSASPAASLLLVNKGSTSGTFTLDVSNLSGEYFIGFSASTWVNSGHNITLKVYNWELKG